MSRRNPWDNPKDRAAIIHGMKLAAIKRASNSLNLMHALIDERIAAMPKAPIKVKGIAVPGFTAKDGKLIKKSTAPPHVKQAQRHSRKVKPTKRVKGVQRP